MTNRFVYSVVFGLFILFLLLTLAGPTPSADEDTGDRVELTILYTGDEYGYLDPCG